MSMLDNRRAAEGALSDIAEEAGTSADAQGTLEVLRVIHTDLFGRQRGKQYPATALGRLAESGLAYSKMSLAEDLLGVPVDEGLFPQLAHHPDLHATLDLPSIRPVPWSSGTAWVLANLVEDGEPSPLCARSQLGGAIEALRSEIGLTAVAAAEPEFYLFDAAADGGGRDPYAKDGVSYSIDRVTDPKGAVDRIHRQLIGFDIGVTVVNREFSPGQFEVNLDHAPALEAADRAFLLKSAIKELAILENLTANFMAKPITGEEGSSLHMHVSLWGENGSNVFADADTTDGLTPVARAAIAGIQAHADAIMAFAAPTVNSYKRIAGPGLSPRRSNWGLDDRFTFVRVPAERGSATRFELRAGDASASPHLLLAAILHAARDGIKRDLVPGEGVELPTSLGASIDALEASDLFRAGFGEEFVGVYAAIKRAEEAALSVSVTDWEWDLYSRTV